jgi:hypothetical protein
MTDQPAMRTPEPEPPAPRPNTSRRSFLVGTGAGAGATALSGLALGAGSAHADTLDARPGEDTPADGALVAYVRDLDKGEISLMRGDREVVVTDRELARTLARKAR